MKWFSVLFSFLFSAIVAAAQPSLRNAERVTISGSEYVRMRDWADAVGLTVRWTTRDVDLLLTNKFCRINFSVKSIHSRLNGMDLRLCLPIVSQNGGVYISRVDLEHTLHPLLFPPRNTPGEKVNVVCIDPGHGGVDKGKIDKTHYEKRYTLLLASEVSKLLKQNGIKVIFTRTKDETVDLSERASRANRHQADLFLSLHFNAADSRQVRGSEIYSMTPAGVESSNSGWGRSPIGSYSGNKNNKKNMLLAYTIQRSVLRNTGLPDRGLKRARFIVLRDVKMPAALIEGGFMTSPDDARKIYDANFRSKLAHGIVDGVLAYKKIVEGSSTTPAIAAN